MEFAERVADPGSGAGAGAAAAMVAALAAALLEKASGLEGARELRERATALVEESEAAFGAAWDELARAGEGGRDEALGGAMDRATAAPLAVAGTAAEIAELARASVDQVAPIVRAEAVAAAVLAEAICTICAHLVEINLVSGNLVPVQEEARGYVGRAAAARAALTVS
ncbi:MAG: Formiminotransferase-cyclodeaminase [Solirubrobacteraceae bacterium]|jgi:formiminotetrahydrofolate cyclodeaminase|nr:Formiminotransferase-cyclodeaminase [Solirubrobacteraceae bacterium]